MNTADSRPDASRVMTPPEVAALLREIADIAGTTVRVLERAVGTEERLNARLGKLEQRVARSPARSQSRTLRPLGAAGSSRRLPAGCTTLWRRAASLTTVPLHRPGLAPARSGLTHPAHEISDRADDEIGIVAMHVMP